MAAPLFAAVSPGLPPPCLPVVEQPTEKALFSETTPSQLDFPDEFPYEYDSSSAFTSPGDSTETEDETSDDEEDFLAGLNRRLSLSSQRLPLRPPSPSFVTDKAEVKPANSIESTLSGLGSYSTSGNTSPNGPFSQVPSPPPSPFSEEDSLKVISAAAGEVAKMKTANFDANPSNPNPNRFVLFPQNAAFCNYYWLWQLQRQNAYYYQSPIKFASTLQPASIASPFPVGGVFPAPTAVKTPSTGTGVFLPRTHPNTADSGKKSGYVKPQTKVVHQQNPKTKEFGRCQSQSKVRLSTGRSKVELVKEKRHLPQERMY